MTIDGMPLIDVHPHVARLPTVKDAWNLKVEGADQ
jgi:hypothetical protein